MRFKKFILCYTVGKKNQVWEEIIGKENMYVRMAEICDETGLTDDKIMVFEKNSQWKTRKRFVRRGKCCVEKVGKYYLTFMDTFIGNTYYQEVTIKKIKHGVTKSKKTIYFRLDGDHVYPKFRNEKQVEHFLRYKNNAKLSICKKDE